MGDKDGAIDLLERAYTAGNGQLRYLKTEPLYESLRNDVRFRALVKKVGFPE